MLRSLTVLALAAALALLLPTPLHAEPALEFSAGRTAEAGVGVEHAAALADTAEVARYATLGQAIAGEIYQEAKLTANDADIGDRFGWAVSLDGDRALVGASRDDEAGLNSGAAYVFAFDEGQPLGQQWRLEGKLTANDASAADYLGTWVSLSGDRAVVGAGGGDSGSAAYVFAFDGTQPEGQHWVQQAKLSVDGVDLRAASLDGDRVLLGASGVADFAGAVYVYGFDGTQPPGQQWSQQAVLTADDADPGDAFGRSVSLDGDRALIGAGSDDGAATDAGAAYVFAFDGAAWSQEAKLTADDATSGVVFGEAFGSSVSLSGDRALIGAPYKKFNDTGWSGAAYMFAFDGAAWSQEAKLDPIGPGGFVDKAGQSVSLDGDRALVGTDPAIPDNGGPLFGSAYLFAFDGASWSQKARLSADDEAENDDFGWSVSLSDGRALIGARFDDVDGAKDAGSAYIINLDADLPLVADAGPDQIVVVGRSVLFDGTGSTGAETFSWTLDGAPIVGADAATAGFCPTEPGVYIATLTVSAGGDSDADDVTATVLSAVAAIDALIADVLATTALSRAQARLLISELRKAQRALERGIDPSTLPFTFLTNFQGSVLGFKVNGTLTAAQADALVDPADEIINAVLSPCSPSAAPPLASASAAPGFGLEPPAPNPSTGRTTVAFSVEMAGAVQLAVYDALGREVAVLVDGAVEAGRHTAGLGGATLPAGTYLVRLTTGDGQTATQRLTRLR